MVSPLKHLLNALAFPLRTLVLKEDLKPILDHAGLYDVLLN